MSAGAMIRDGQPTFTLFRNLPPELQLKIWHYSLPGPRIIEVAYRGDLDCFFNGARPPPVFQACQDSREVALSIYKPLSAILQDWPLGNPLKTLPPIYFNLVHDIIYISNPSNNGKFVDPELLQLGDSDNSEKSDDSDSLVVDFDSSDD